MGRLKEYRKDLILILAVLVGAGLIAGAFALARKPGAYVRVERNGKTVALYPLNEDRREVFPEEDGSALNFGEGTAGNVLVIENGVVTESGTHDELLALNGSYARMHRIQSTSIGGVA